MKYLSLLGFAILLVGAGCSQSADNSATVSLSETQEIPAAQATDQEDVTQEVAVDGSGEVAIEVDLDLGEDGAVVVTEVTKAEEVVISMTAEGFEPSTITVSTGTKVTFVNNDSVKRWPASAFHPTHLELPEFDSLEGIALGASYSFTFTETGTWKFHDHLIPSLFGSVVVE